MRRRPGSRCRPGDEDVLPSTPGGRWRWLPRSRSLPLLPVTLRMFAMPLAALLKTPVATRRGQIDGDAGGQSGVVEGVDAAAASILPRTCRPRPGSGKQRSFPPRPVKVASTHD